MKRLNWIKWIILLTLFWTVLEGTMSFKTVLIGIMVSMLALSFTDRFLIGQQYHHLHGVKLFGLFGYFFFLMKEVYIAGGDMIKMIITHKINPAIVEIETDLLEDYQRVILANSITITPGTITVDLTDNTLKVLWINKTTDDPEEIKKIITADIEKRLKKL